MHQSGCFAKGYVFWNKDNNSRIYEVNLKT